MTEVKQLQVLVAITLVLGCVTFFIVIVVWCVLVSLIKRLRAVSTDLQNLTLNLKRLENGLNSMAVDLSNADREMTLVRNGGAEVLSQLAHVFGVMSDVKERVTALCNRYVK